MLKERFSVTGRQRRSSAERFVKASAGASYKAGPSFPSFWKRKSHSKADSTLKQSKIIFRGIIAAALLASCARQLERGFLGEGDGGEERMGNVLQL